MCDLRTVVVIPARAGSKRLPNKNFKTFLNAPLYEWSVNFAKKLDWIETIVLSTDEINLSPPSEVVFVERPFF